MKKVMFPLLCVFAILLTYPQETKTEKLAINDINSDRLNWVLTYKEALKRSKEENKPVLMYFTGSDWCGPCIRLDKELFHTEKFKEFSDKELILLEVDIPRQQDLLTQDKLSENLYLKKKFKVNSFPTLIFVNHRGRKIAEKSGYIMTEYYYPFIQSVIQKF